VGDLVKGKKLWRYGASEAGCNAILSALNTIGRSSFSVAGSYFLTLFLPMRGLLSGKSHPIYRGEMARGS